MLPFLVALMVVIVLLFVGVTAFRHLGNYLKWEHRATRGDRFFALPSDAREAFKASLRRRSFFAHGIMRLLARAQGGPKAPPTFTYEGIHFPRTTTKPSILDAARAYEPSAADVFVASHMKSGTTWTLHVVYQILQRGRGDLSDEGHRHIHAACAWIETHLAVDLDKAPTLGVPPRRVIKTHLTAELCPYAAEARYVVVARHPASVCASAVDFMRMMSGPLAPSADFLAEWWVSREVLWGPWPEHILGWWRKSEREANVFFVTFEEMKDDLPAVIRRLAPFLGVELDEAEVTQVAEQCSFAVMKAHEERFEMSPPNLFSVRHEASFLKTGARDRGADLSEANRALIEAAACEALEPTEFPLERYYPDLARADDAGAKVSR